MNKDLHTSKASHVALPIDAKVEWHLNNNDVTNLKPVSNQTYLMITPVICTSADEDGSRFRQIEKTYVVPQRVFANTDSDVVGGGTPGVNRPLTVRTIGGSSKDLKR